MNRKIGISLIVMSLITLAACNHRPATPEEQAMVRETLINTSPRNLNEHPKAVQELKINFGKGAVKRKPYTEEDVSDKDILQNNP